MIDPLGSTITISSHDLAEVAGASRRLAEDENTGLSQHELTVAAFINGRLDLLAGDAKDYRRALISAGPVWCHAAIEALFQNHLAEMTLPRDHPAAPIGDQLLLRSKE